MNLYIIPFPVTYMSEIRLGQYKHFKGNLYEVIAVGKDCETQEDVVVYKALNGSGDSPVGQV